MNFSIFIIFAGLLAYLTYLLLILNLKKKRTNNHIEESTLFLKRPLTSPEQAFYWRLLKAFPDKLILPQVSFSRFLYAKGKSKKANFSKFSRVRQKVADYVICDKAFNVLGIIELDDTSHNLEKDRQRDNFLNEAGIRVFRFNVAQIPDTEKLQKIFSWL